MMVLMAPRVAQISHAFRPALRIRVHPESIMPKLYVFFLDGWRDGIDVDIANRASLILNDDSPDMVNPDRAPF